MLYTKAKYHTVVGVDPARRRPVARCQNSLLGGGQANQTPIIKKETAPTLDTDAGPVTVEDDPPVLEPHMARLAERTDEAEV